MQITFRFFIPCFLCLSLLVVSGCGGGSTSTGGGTRFNEAAIPALSAAEQAETEDFISKHGKNTVFEYLDAFVIAFTEKKPDIRYVKHFISKGGDVNAKDSSGVTPLHHAVRLDLEITKYLVSKGAVKFLISKGANVNARKNMLYATGDGTPLHYAVRDGNTEIANILISSRADVNAVASGSFNDGRHLANVTPLAIAKARGDTAMAQLLESKGAK
jgi:ankyrin repeat protein